MTVLCLFPAVSFALFHCSTLDPILEAMDTVLVFGAVLFAAGFFCNLTRLLVSPFIPLEDFDFIGVVSDLDRSIIDDDGTF